MAEHGRLRAAVIDDVIVADGDGPTFAHARRLGFAGVEVALRPDDLGSRQRIDSVRRAQQATGLAVPWLVLGPHNERGGIADADPAVSLRAGEDVRRALDWASELGADLILLPFFLRAELVDEEDLDRAAAAFRPLCELAGERGLMLCYEGTLPAERVRLLAERVDSAAFGCYFDLANAVRWGLDSATEIRALGTLVRRVHVKETGARPGLSRPGTGLVDFAASAAALDEIGYEGWLVLETPAGQPELVARDLSFARSAFPALIGPPWPCFGMFTYDFGRGEWDELVETCTRYGVEAVQVGRELLDECLEQPDRIDAFRSRLEENGIAIAAIAGYRNLVAPDAKARRENLEYIARCLELAPRFATSIVATETGTRNPSSDWLDSAENRSAATWELLCEAIAELLEIAERHGSILALEAHVRNVLATYQQLETLLDRFPSPNLQVVLDPYNYVSRPLLPAQGPVTERFLDRFEHRFVLAHLKDVSGDASKTIEFGTGVFPQRPYLEFLRDRRPDLPLIVEHLPLDHVPAAFQRVRDLVS